MATISRKYLALVFFTSTIAVSSVASTQSEKFTRETRMEQIQIAQAPALLATEVIFDRPETTEAKLETYATVIDGAVILPEAHCNSPGHMAEA